MFHAKNALEYNYTTALILPSDSDVSILLYYWDIFKEMGLIQLWVKGGTSQAVHFIPIHSLSDHLGRDICKVLPSVHTFTGTDYTSKVGTKMSITLPRKLWRESSTR